MKKTYTINLSGKIFHIDEDALEKLQEYINTLKTYYSTSDTKNIVWYFNKGKAETHVAASDMGKIRKITINPNSARKPELLTCTYGTSATVLAATEPTGTNSSTITFDFAAAGVDASDFRIGFSDTSTNIEIGKVVIEYTR